MLQGRIFQIAILLLLSAPSAYAAGLSKRQLRFRAERRSCRFVTAATSSAAGYGLASSLKETYTPPGLAVRPLTRTLLTPREQVFLPCCSEHQPKKQDARFGSV